MRIWVTSYGIINLFGKGGESIPKEEREFAMYDFYRTNPSRIKKIESWFEYEDGLAIKGLICGYDNTENDEKLVFGKIFERVCEIIGPLKNVNFLKIENEDFTDEVKDLVKNLEGKQGLYNV